MPLGCLISVPRDRFDPQLVDRMVSFDSMYSSRVSEKVKDVEIAKRNKKSAAFSFRTSSDFKVKIFINAYSPYTVIETKALGEENSNQPDVEITDVFDVYNLNYKDRGIESMTVKADLMMKGDIITKKPMSGGKALWVYDEYSKLHLFPVTDEVAESKDGMAIVFKSYNSAVLINTKGKTKQLFATESSIDWKNMIRYAVIPQKDGDYYHFPGFDARFTISLNRSKELDDMLKNYKDVMNFDIDASIVTPDPDVLPHVQYFITVTTHKDGKSENKRFPIRFLTDDKE